MHYIAYMTFSIVKTYRQTNLHAVLNSEPTIDESTIERPTPRSVEQAQQSLNFQIMEGASERLKPTLIDSCRYSYNIKRERLNATDWKCTVRPTVSLWGVFCNPNNVKGLHHQSILCA